MQDSFLDKGKRKKLVEQLFQKGISDRRVLEALGRVPRQWFMESGIAHRAYEDVALPIGAGQTISQPYTVAFQSQLLQIEPGQKVLEVGTGSGYQTAVLLELEAKVFSIERQLRLHQQTKQLLEAIGYHKAKLFHGDGFEGKSGYGPFDKIVVTAAPAEVPSKLLEQLAIGGLFVCPIGKQNAQTMVRIQRISETEYKSEKQGLFTFVPMLKGLER